MLHWSVLFVCNMNISSWYPEAASSAAACTHLHTAVRIRGSSCPNTTLWVLQTVSGLHQLPCVSSSPKCCSSHSKVDMGPIPHRPSLQPQPALWLTGLVSALNCYSCMLFLWLACSTVTLISHHIS